MKPALLYLIGIVVVILLVTALVFWAGWLQLPWMNLQTHAMRESNQFVTSTVSELMDKQAAWERLDTDAAKTDDAEIVAGYRAQQNALLVSMKSEAQLIDPDYIPTSVAAFLAAH